eukprot:5657149-Ditylum_brightwellii.AAC.1
MNAYIERKKYCDEELANIIFASAYKQPLTSDPSIKEFQYGTNWGGYWGHPDGLNPNDMNKGWGRKQNIPHDSILNEGCLEAFNPKLKTGDIKCFKLSKADYMPFWMSPQYCLWLQFDERQIPGDFQEKVCKIDKLRNILKNTDFATDRYKKDLWNRCEDNYLYWKERTPKIEHGWLNEAKGMQQIKWERSLLDSNKVYQVAPGKDKNRLGVKDKS